MIYIQDKSIGELFDKIKEMRIIRGEISTDPTIYEFHFEEMLINQKKENIVIKVCAEKLDNSREFRKQYQKMVYLPAVRFKNDEWDNFLYSFGAKTKFKDTLEESEYVFKAREIFEIICDFNISDSSNEALVNKTLYDYNGNYYLSSKKVRDIVDTYGFHIPFNILSSTMTELGYKRAGTPAIRISGTQIRCWAFIPEKIKEVKE